MIPKGTTILEEKPFAHVLMLDLQETHCDYCLSKKKDVKKCAKCGRVSYCNVECQTLGWKQCHKYECKDLSACPNDISEDTRLLARIIWKLKKKSDKEKFYNLDGGNKEFWEDEIQLCRFEACFYDLCKFMRLSKAPRMRVVKEIYSRMIINCFKIFDHNFKIVGEGFHLLPKSLKHSCNPNVAYVYFEQTIIISTVEDLPEINWDNLTKRFADPVQNTTQRKKALKMYSRDCSCNRCIYPERDALCPNESCRAACSIEEDACPVCNEVLTKEFKKSYLDAIQFTNENIDFFSLSPDRFKMMNLCMKKLQKVVSPVNYKYIHLLEKMHVMESANRHWMRSLKYLEEILVGFLHFYGPLNVQLALIYIQLAKLHQRLDNKKEYVEAVNNSGKILKSLFGVDRAKEVMQRITSGFNKKVYKNEKFALYQEMQKLAEKSHSFVMKF